MKKTQIIKESLVATTVIILITFLISSLPLKNELLKGIRQDVNGFDIYDLAFNDDRQKYVRDTNVILVQMGNTRDEIADQIELIQSYKPAVLGIDAFFEAPKDTLADNHLLQTLRKYENVVFGFALDDPDGKMKITKKNFFEQDIGAKRSGYLNFVGNEFAVIRTYPPFYKVDNVQVPAFTSRIVEMYAPEKFAKLKSTETPEFVINYSGNVSDKYISFGKEELLEYHATNQLQSLLKSKIILLGYFIKDPPLVLEDLHFSPLNENIAGKSFPDMYGIAIHANILSMILENKLAVPASNFMSYFFAFLITFFFLWYVLHLYAKKSHPSHAIILLLQLGIILLMIFVFVQIFDLFLWKLPLTPLVISLVLCIELLGLYKLIAIWLHKKTGFVTVFNKK
jgi:hypothetical protein